MPKRAKELTAIEVKRASHPGSPDRNVWVHAGGVSGLMLQITPNNSKSWLLRTTIAGSRRAIGLGPYPEISLAEARDLARNAKAKVRDGIDPIEERKAVRATLAAETARTLLFEDAADRWIAAKLSERPLKSQKAVRAMLERYAFHAIGKMTVQGIAVQDILRCLENVWVEKPDTGKKLRSYLESVLSWATVAGHRTGDNPARWGGNLKELLPSTSSVEKGKKGNFPAVAVSDLPAFWKDLRGRGGMGALALQFAILCASRSGEVRGARWDEIDKGAKLWTIPATRMKAGREHRVALPDAAIELLDALPKTSELVFPAIRGGMLSDMSISAVMRRMQADAEADAKKLGQSIDKAGWRDPRSGKPAVPHGLRSSFRDWAAERGYDRDIAEMSLAHAVGSAVERAYRRTDMIDRRRAIMSAWADYLYGKATGVVVAFPGEVRA